MKRALKSVLFMLSFLWMANMAYPQPVNAHMQSEKLARGVNIIGYDKAFWQDRDNGRFKESYFKMIKEAGFSNIRVNLHAFSHMDESYQFDPGWLETLDWVVEKGLEANLMVILDMHEFNQMADDPVGKKGMFLSVWRQLAPRYKDAPSQLLFEVLNEPNQKLTVEMWNEYLAEAVDIIRETNPSRTLIIGPANWNGIESLPTLKLPENDDNIIVTVHFYHPMEFTHQGAPWSSKNKELSGIKWLGTKKEKDLIETKFRFASDWSKDNHKPIFIGEFGASDKGEMD